MSSKRFIYLIPSEKSFYKVRNERFIINVLKDLSHHIIEINNFYKKGELNLPLISNIIESNNEHLNWTVGQLLSLKNNNNLEQIVLVGAAFKENTDDLRNSPTLDIYKILDDMGVQVSILDTEIKVPNHNYFSSVEYVDSKSLIAIMYPINEDLDKKLLDHSSQNDCIIFYPWR